MSELAEVCKQKLASAVPGEARRLFHGRGHFYPGMEDVVVNWFPPCLQVVLFAERTEQEVRALTDPLVAELDQVAEIEGVVVQYRRGRATQTEIIRGRVDDEMVVQEAGLKYWIQPLKNQNVGLFMDMAHVRAWLNERVAGRKVLNLFAYTCAFSVSAIEHGADLVVNNDMSKNSLAWGERNHGLNDHDLRKVRMLPHNVFKSWWKIRQFAPYDVIIIDPPTNQRGSFVAEKSYGQIVKRIPELAASGADILACLNSPFLNEDFLHGQMQRFAPACQFQARLPLHPDFPDKFPERALKVMHYRC